MAVYRIPRELWFPDPAIADPSGLLGVGGDLSPERLLLAYRSGIFPWYSHDQPILWWSPDPRMVLESAHLQVPRSLAKRIRQQPYTITLDRAFSQVLAGCASAPRPGQDGTWLTPEMQAAYLKLHQLGFAHSCEAWRDGELVGGLYGVAVGHLYCGESMFARANDASKIAFVWLTQQLRDWGFPVIDCQVHTKHLDRFGATEIPRRDYLTHVARLSALPRTAAQWSFDAGFVPDPLRASHTNL